MFIENNNNNPKKSNAKQNNTQIYPLNIGVGHLKTQIFVLDFFFYMFLS